MGLLVEVSRNSPWILECKNNLLKANSAPGGAAAIVLIALYLPSASVSSGQKTMKAQLRSKFSKASLSRIEILGVILLAASILLVFALEEAGQRYSWKSAVIICTITLAGICWTCFVNWEFFVEKSHSTGTNSPSTPAQRSYFGGHDEHGLLHRLPFRQHYSQYPSTSASRQPALARACGHSSAPLAADLSIRNCRTRSPDLELHTTFLLDADWRIATACWCQSDELAADRYA